MGTEGRGLFPAGGLHITSMKTYECIGTVIKTEGNNVVVASRGEVLHIDACEVVILHDGRVMKIKEDSFVYVTDDGLIGGV